MFSQEARMRPELVKRFCDFVDRQGMPTDSLMAINDQELLPLLQEYVDALQANIPESTSHQSQQFVSYRSSLSTSLNSASFLASAIAYKCVYFDDPIASMYIPDSQFVFGCKSIDRYRLASAIHRVRTLRPLIEEGVVVPIPISMLHHRKDVPVLYSEDGFQSHLSESVVRFAQEHSIIYPVEFGSDAIIVQVKPVECSVNGIAVTFQGDTNPVGKIYRRADISFDPDSPGNFAFRASEQQAPPSIDDFKRWVTQSINQTILNKLEHIARELCTSGAPGCILQH